MELYTRNAVNYSFLLLCIERMLNYGLKSQQIVLHANLQCEMVLTIFTIFGGYSYSTAYNSSINYDRNKIFAVLKQSGNYLFQTWYVKRIYP